MTYNLSTDQPELVFGLVGPLGVDMSSVQEALSAALRQVHYEPYNIHLTQEVPSSFPHLVADQDSAITFAGKIKAVNDLRKNSDSKDILALFAILQIVSRRKKINENDSSIPKEERGKTPTSKSAFIVRQLKRVEETRTLAKAYGKRFLQVSVSIGEEQQKQAVRTIVVDENPYLSNEEVEAEVGRLISTDQNEGDDPYGQRLSDTFQDGDVFIDGSNDKSIREDCQRFVNAIFGMNSISPTIDEFGSYMAKAASLRSIDMSRQVGSAIMSPEGDIIAVGCNEVPRAGGGNYWCSDSNPQRDIDRKVEANKLETNRIIHNFIEVIHRHGSLKKDPTQLLNDESFLRLVKESQISDITEFGRMTHAEMTAIADAARMGRSVKGATIYVTTYPCHNCAKHLVAAGIMRIVYIEPYPKSRALTLHGDSLSHDATNGQKVCLEHFHGISPRRFRDVFEKGKRKSKGGGANIWYEETPKPRVGERFSTHVLLEVGFLDVFKDAIEKLREFDAGPKQPDRS
ncbi:anti-phage dCTP deaminase [Phaeobacter sp. JH20_26]|uniref:anti-phage dCTP deaminase n=1 Tax=Phaeobacter sp. JH20_26 TaxID=3112483 RepID=UPI003A849D9B